VDERRRAPGTLEQEILVVLSTQNGALTPAQVRRALGRDLAYTTVMTVLTRLHDKGFVQRKRAGRAFAYRWQADGAALAGRAMGRLLDSVDDRAAVLARFVGELSPADVEVLADLFPVGSKDSTTNPCAFVRSPRATTTQRVIDFPNTL
jgi:predicted transcriptional regulator